MDFMLFKIFNAEIKLCHSIVGQPCQCKAQLKFSTLYKKKFGIKLLYI